MKLRRTKQKVSVFWTTLYVTYRISNANEYYYGASIHTSI